MRMQGSLFLAACGIVKIQPTTAAFSDLVASITEFVQFKQGPPWAQGERALLLVPDDVRLDGLHVDEDAVCFWLKKSKKAVCNPPLKSTEKLQRQGWRAFTDWVSSNVASTFKLVVAALLAVSVALCSAGFYAAGYTLGKKEAAQSYKKTLQECETRAVDAEGRTHAAKIALNDTRKKHKKQQRSSLTAYNDLEREALDGQRNARLTEEDLFETAQANTPRAFFCAICMASSNRAQLVVCEPCGHICICKGCAEERQAQRALNRKRPFKCCGPRGVTCGREVTHYIVIDKPTLSGEPAAYTP